MKSSHHGSLQRSCSCRDANNLFVVLGNVILFLFPYQFLFCFVSRRFAGSRVPTVTCRFAPAETQKTFLVCWAMSFCYCFRISISICFVSRRLAGSSFPNATCRLAYIYIYIARELFVASARRNGNACARTRLQGFCHAQVSCVVYVGTGSTRICCVVQERILSHARRTDIDGGTDTDISWLSVLTLSQSVLGSYDIWSI